MVDYPPFAGFSRFIQEVAKERNDSYLKLESCDESESFHGISTTKTAVTTPESPEKVKSVESPDKWCFLHERPHPLRVCRELRSRPYSERLDLLARRHICFRCVSSSSHTAKDCTFTPNCGICHSDRHVTALHIDRAERDASRFSKTGKKHGEEQEAETSQRTEPPDVTNRCTEVCGQNTVGIGRSCAKICLADVYDPSAPHVTIRTYVIIDDQSNHSLARAKLFDKLNIKGSATSYTLKTCSGVKQTLGRRAHGLVIEFLDKQVRYQLPTLTECDEIPNNREEIPTPEVA